MTDPKVARPNDTTTRRRLRPRTTLAVAPVVVTQENCAAVLGVDPRRYLEAIVPLCAGHVAPIGKLRAIPVDVVIEAMRELAAKTSDDAAPAIVIDGAPTTGAAVLEALGMRATRTA